jgi:CSLREA domain-containing protein
MFRALRISPYQAITAVLAAVGLVALGALVFSRPTQAGGPIYTITVTTDDSDNNGNCTLREAIEASILNAAVDLCPAGHPLGPDRIELSEDVYELSNHLSVSAGGPIEIVGVSPEHSAIDGNDSSIVLALANAAADVTIEHVEIINGRAAGSGGGIQQNSGTLELRDVRVANNTAAIAGGGVFNGNGSLFIEDSVFTGNVAEGGTGGSAIFTGGDDAMTSLVDVTIGSNGGPAAASGGGIALSGGSLAIRRTTITGNEVGIGAGIDAGGGIRVASGSLTLANSTISGNSAENGGGISVAAGTVTMAHVTITGNTTPLGADGISGAEAVTVRNSIIANGPNNCDEPVVSGGYNLEDADDCGLNAIGDLINGNADLEPLGDNGGPTLTHALGPDSQVLSLVGALCAADDQRGVARPQGDGCDAGSFESGLPAPPTPSPSPTPSPTQPPGQQVAWGDNNCSDVVDSVDALITLRFDAGLAAETHECPEMGAEVEVANASTHFWGDLDCSGAVNSVDALKVLRHDAGLSVEQPPSCPDPGEIVTVQ